MKINSLRGFSSLSLLTMYSMALLMSDLSSLLPGILDAPGSRSILVLNQSQSRHWSAEPEIEPQVSQNRARKKELRSRLCVQRRERQGRFSRLAFFDVNPEKIRNVASQPGSHQVVVNDIDDNHGG